MLSSMTPTIVARDGKLFMVMGSPGGRTIINTVLLTILNVVDFGMNVAGGDRRRHGSTTSGCPTGSCYERYGLSPDTVALLRARGHDVRSGRAIPTQGVAEGIVYDAAEDLLEGGSDRRAPDGAAIGR